MYDVCVSHDQHDMVSQIKHHDKNKHVRLCISHDMVSQLKHHDKNKHV